MAAIPGAHIETIESKWSQALDRMFDTPESKAYAPRPHLWVAFLHSEHSRRGLYVPPDGEASRHEPVPVRINHGVWQTCCPFCPSAQHASRTDRWFYCATCHNEENGNRSIRVEWPNSADAIEALLVERPWKENRNWEPGETIADLMRQGE